MMGFNIKKRRSVEIDEHEKNFVRVFCLLLAYLLLLLVVFFFSENASATSTSQATSWVNSSIGKSYDFDGVYGAQCFDYINKYAYDLFGTSFSGAGAIDLLNTGNKNGFKVIRDGANLYPQTGDIFYISGIWLTLGTYRNCY